MWNTQKSIDPPCLMRSAANLHSQAPAAQHNLSLLPDNRGQGQAVLLRPMSQSTATNPSITHRVAQSVYSDDALPSQLQIVQPVVSSVAPGSQHKHPKNNPLGNLRSVSPCQPHFPQSLAAGDVHRLLAMVIFLIDPSPGGSTLVALLLKTATTGSKQWNNQCPPPVVKPVKTRKSCYRWIAAIIQRLWNTAWDLLAHHNVESIRS